MKVLVTGSAGMLGSAVMAHLAAAGHSAVGLDLGSKDPACRVDVSNWEQLRRVPHWKDADLVLHLAAATNVDQCETDPDFAFRINALAPQLVARLCAERSIPILYVGTSAIFAGNPKADPYTEYDDIAPVNVYAKSKLRGEEAVRETTPRHFIVRAGWMMGGGAEEKKFVGKIVAQIQAGQKRLLAVSDKRGTLTYTVDFARNMMDLIAGGHYGTYHMANPGVCTRYDVAKSIVEILGAPVEVEAVPSSRFPLPAPRPDSESLRNLKLGLLGLDRMPPWRDSLRDYLQTLVPSL